MTQAEINAGARPGATTTAAEKLAELGERCGCCAGRHDLAVGIGILRGGARPPLPLIVDYITANSEDFGVEQKSVPSSPRPVEIGPSTHYAARPPASTRAVRDEPLVPVAAQLREDNDGVYGVHKMHPALASKGGLDELIAPLVTDLAPQLLGRCGTGIEVAGQLVVSRGKPGPAAQRGQLRTSLHPLRNLLSGDSQSPSKPGA